MENIVIFKSNDFKYPSQDERKEAIKGYPDLECFDFEHKSGIKSILTDKMPLKEASRKENLFWWNSYLQNRLGSLQESYIYMITNYNRGFSDGYLKCHENEYINKFLFDYYAEIFYYYLFSTKDIIAQILNLYFSIDLDEEKVYVNKSFLENISGKDKGLFKNFDKATEEAKKIRNSFAHRFSPNHPDYRLVYSIHNDSESVRIGGRIFTSSDKIVKNINNSLKKLQTLILDLKKIMK